MHKTGILRFIVTLILSSSFLPLNAQTEKIAMHFSALEMGAKELGNAGTSFICQRDERVNINAGYTLYSLSESPVSYMNLMGEYRLSKNISISLEGLYGLCKEYEMIDLSGNSIGTYKPDQKMVSVGAKLSFLKRFRVEVKGKYINENIAPQKGYNAFAADLIVMGRAISKEKAALEIFAGMRNLGTEVTSSNGVKFSLPTSVLAGVSYRTDIGNKGRIDLASELNYYLHGSIAAKVGAGFTFNDFVSVKAGYRYGGKSVIPSFVSVGAGIRLFGVSLDLAYLSGIDNKSNSMALSLGYSF